MATISEALATAVHHHQAGRLQAAEEIYRRILAVEPNQADAIHLLGVIAGQASHHEMAVEYIGRAIALRRTEAPFHNNLGEAYRALGKISEAVACYRQALELKPDFAEAHNNLGNALREQKSLEEAVACHRRALALRPDYSTAYSNLGVALTDQGKLDEAVAAFHRSLELQPDSAEALNALANALTRQQKLDGAIACYRRACVLRPGYTEAHYNLAGALQDQGKLEDAAASCRRALELKPNYAEAHHQLGNISLAQAKPQEAVASCSRALELKPDSAEAHVTRAFAWLLTGDLEHGWPEYEWRWRLKVLPSRRILQPRWDGQELAGKTILLDAEQGLGDTIQFIRYAALLAERGATVIVECPKPLVPLLRDCPGIDRVFAYGDDLPAFDVHVPLMSVPGILGTTLATIPANVPYLCARLALVEQWPDRLNQLRGFKIGINWQGSAKQRDDRFRSIPLRDFGPLAALPGVHLISLQHGFGTEQLTQVRDLFVVTDLGRDLHREATPFLDVSAVMKSLDLVITADTALAHLAGALGVPVWVALRFSSDWRWLLDRSDSPWYPTLRLFRQRTFGDWAGVFSEMEDALRDRLQSDGLASPSP